MEKRLGSVKSHTYYTFTLLPGIEIGLMTVFNKELKLTISLPLGYKNDKVRFYELEIFNVAFLKYEVRMPLYIQAKASVYAAKYYLKKRYISML
ncbi:MAG: hypothetical protein ABI045_02800 [Flavobacteriales bacterium]